MPYKSIYSYNRVFSVCLLVFLLLPFCFKSQSADSLTSPQARQELWPEIDLFYRINDKCRVTAFYSATRLKTSSFTDGSLTLNFDYFALPVWRHKEVRADSTRGSLLWFRGGLSYASSPHDDIRKIEDYTIITEITTRFYLPHKLLLSVRNRVDWRWRNDDFQPRYRLKARLERNFKTEFLTFNVYTFSEVFFNFSSKNSNRARLALGSEFKVLKHMNVDLYYMYQFDGNREVLEVHAIGIKLIFHF
jgi:hypothetical protein